MQNKDGKTALMLAAEKGHAELVGALLARGADANLRDRFGRTALEYAATSSYSAVVTLLDGSTGANSEATGVGTDKWAEPKKDTSVLQGGLDFGCAAMFVFDYEHMGNAYGVEAFAAIAECLEGSAGICAFLDGDLEVAAGGVSRVPGLLMEIRDNGWNITSHRSDSPLVLLATQARICAYVTALWTDTADIIPRLHKYLSHALPDAYLGYLGQPKGLDLAMFHEIFRPLSLPVRVTFTDGVSQ